MSNSVRAGRRRWVWVLAGVVLIMGFAAVATGVGVVVAPRWQGREDYRALPTADAVYDGSKQPQLARYFEGSGYGVGPHKESGVWFGKSNVPAGPINIDLRLFPATATRSGVDIANDDVGPSDDVALDGLGDEAYGTKPDPASTTANVRLRIRNVRVDITYRGLKGLVATDVVRSLAEAAVREVERAN